MHENECNKNNGRGKKRKNLEAECDNRRKQQQQKPTFGFKAKLIWQRAPKSAPN